MQQKEKYHNRNVRKTEKIGEYQIIYINVDLANVKKKNYICNPRHNSEQCRVKSRLPANHLPHPHIDTTSHHPSITSK